jgi:Fur family zinc uptake transcriptional regulator
LKEKQIVTSFKPANHQHASCLKDALSTVEVCCQERGLKLTPIRRRVLELVWKTHEPVKAYDILETLQAEKKGSAPPTVYRALDFLQQEGFVHKLESMNAYIGCGAPGHRHTSQFLICHDCGVVAELDDDDIGMLIDTKADSLGFKANQLTIEIKGLCHSCQGA